MKFAGNDKTYLSQKKVDKIKAIIESNKQNKEAAPQLNNLHDLIENKEDKKEEDKKMEVEDKKEEEEDKKEEDKKEEDKKEDKKEEDKKEEDKKEEDKKEEDKKKKDDNKMDLDDEENEEDIIRKKAKIEIKKNYRKLSVSSNDSNSAISFSEGSLERNYSDEEDNYSNLEAPQVPQNRDKEIHKEVDSNVFVIEFSSLRDKNNVETLYSKPIKCERCQSILNSFSNVKKIEGNNYDWLCDYCNQLNKIKINDEKEIPTSKIVEYATKVEVKEVKKKNNTIIFCTDISGSMAQSYSVSKSLIKQLKRNKKQDKTKFDFYDRNNLDDSFENDFNYQSNNQDYISRLECVQAAIDNNINNILKTSPETHVGLVTFSSEITILGDCCSNQVVIRQDNFTNEQKLNDFGTENSNLIKNPINNSIKNILKSLYKLNENGQTALGPALYVSMSLLFNNNQNGEIFLCTDGRANLGLGKLNDVNGEEDQQSLNYYNKLGDIAKEKGITINLITFEDQDSDINALSDMIQKSGGEIIRVNPTKIIEEFNDMFENTLIGTNVKLNVNLNKLLCFRNEDKKENLYNDGSSYKEEIGNVKLETEKYFEYKFKKAWKIADMTDINIDNVKNLNFQCVIEYKNRDKEDIIRVINETQTVCRIQKDIEKNINYDIIGTNAMQRSGQLAKVGKYKEAQIESLRWKTFMRNNVNSMNNNVVENYNIFKNNMRSVQSNLLDIRTEIQNKKATKINTEDEVQERFYNVSYKSRKQNRNNFMKKKK
jgi:Mg-chelatase subunit ChlD